MYWLTFFELTGISIASLYLINNYSAKDVPLYVQGIVGFSWIMNFTLIVLVPLDVFITQRNVDAGQDPILDPEYLNLAGFYQCIYWLIFLMCWTVIPIVSDYESAVDFDPQDRLRRSFNANIRFCLAIAVMGLGFIIYVYFTGSAENLGMMMFFKAIANSYGVFLIIGLLGYSLVTIPRAHMRTAHFDLQIKYIYFRTAALSQEKKDAQHDLVERAKKLIAIKNISFENAQFDKYVKLSLDTIPLKIQRAVEQQLQGRKASFIQTLVQPARKNQDIPKDIEDMTLMYRGIKKSYEDLYRIKAALREHLKKAFEMEDIIKSIHSEKQVIEYTFKGKEKGRLQSQKNYCEWMWLCHYKPQFKVLLSVILGVLSFLVLLQEVTLFMKTNFTIFGFFLKLVTNIYWMQIFTFIPLFYMAFCVYYGMFRIKISGFYGLYPDHTTDAASLLFTTVNFSRVSAPLCFNFLHMLRLKYTPAFNYAMGNVELIPIFGISFTAIFPLLLIVLCLINYYDLYDKLMNYLGMKQFLFAENFSDRLIYEGKDQLRAAREHRLTRKSKFMDPSSQNDVKIFVDDVGTLKQKLIG